MRDVILSNAAPQPIGPYSQAIRAGGFVFCAGQTPIDPASGQLVAGSVEEQTARVLENLRAVLEAAGTSLAHAVKTTVYLKDMNDFAAMNATYAEFFPAAAPPARSTIEAARLPKDCRVEIDVIAVVL